VLPHQQFLNLKEMADSHLRRIAAAVLVAETPAKP